MPIVATGVVTVICVESCLAMFPETKMKTPFNMENALEPDCVAGL